MPRGHGGESAEGAAELDGISGPAIATLFEAIIVARERTAADADLLLSPYAAAGRHVETRRLATAIEGAGRGLIRYVTRRGTARTLAQALLGLAAELGPEPTVRSRPERAGAIRWVTDLLRDIGLEEFGLDLGLDIAPEHPVSPTIGFTWRPASPAFIRSVLADRVSHEVLAETARDALARLDHRAASWWFERWSPRTPNDPERALNVQTARAVRCAEYCVAGRPAAGQGVSLIQRFLSDTSRDHPTPTRRAIARALAQSLASLFVVRARVDERSVFEEPTTGVSFHVTDHRPESPYRPGAFALGRVLPLDDGTYARSPAMMFYQHDDPKVMDAVKAWFRERAHEVGPDIAVEGTTSMVSGDRAVPRAVPPTTSADEAQQLFNQAWTQLRRRLGGKPVKPPRDYPAEGRASIEAGESEIRLFMLDRAWYEWLHALDIQAHGEPTHDLKGVLPFAPEKRR